MNHQPRIEVQTAKGYTNRLTVAPDRVTVKIAKDTTPQGCRKVLSFVDYVLEQFVDVNDIWHGEINFELDGVMFGRVVLRSGNKTRSYLGVV